MNIRVHTWKFEENKTKKKPTKSTNPIQYYQNDGNNNNNIEIYE